MDVTVYSYMKLLLHGRKLLFINGEGRFKILLIHKLQYGLNPFLNALFWG